MFTDRFYINMVSVLSDIMTEIRKTNVKIYTSYVEYLDSVLKKIGTIDGYPNDKNH